jgi:hypothetical protein
MSNAKIKSLQEKQVESASKAATGFNGAVCGSEAAMFCESGRRRRTLAKDGEHNHLKEEASTEGSSPSVMGYISSLVTAQTYTSDTFYLAVYGSSAGAIICLQ